MSGISRRDFLWSASLAPALIGLSRKTESPIAGGFVDDNSTVGHAIRDGRTSLPAREQRHTTVVIVGGGIGGLSAGWRLDALGMRDWTLLELAPVTGGNARSGRNVVSAFPWGAHYLPVPSVEATHVRQLMRELGVLGADGQWDERTLCHSPQERLFQHGRWHDGLEPIDALASNERAQFQRFDAVLQEFRQSQAFTVPSAIGHARVGNASMASQRAMRQLDTQTADEWLRAQQFTSPALRWWVEYGMRDDYGCSLSQASAWAAVHYFAARPSAEQGPLTWPEGNDWIAQRLAGRAGDRVRTNAPVTHIERTGARWTVRSPSADLTCDVLIWAAPLFVLPRVLPTVRLPVTTEYAPWVVANITLRRPPEERGAPASWDNVLYDSPSLGYVDAGHQLLSTRPARRVWTWYHAVVDQAGAQGRRWLQQQSWSAWRDRIVGDLGRAHRDIADCIERIDVMRWGHAMARPVPGVLDRVARLQSWTPATNLFIAHADLSSLSLFEEAQWHGVTAADAALRVVGGHRRSPST